MKRVLLHFFILFFCYLPTSWAVVELGMNVGYDKQYFGENRESYSTTLTYSGSLAFYFTSNLALELNYSQSEDDTNQSYSKDTLETVSITHLQNRVFTKVFGIGIRASLGSIKTSRLVPMISLGYAKQFVEDQTTYTLYLTDSDTETTITYVNPKKTIESMFGSFMLQLKITQRFTLKASVKTVFKAFEFNKAKDYLKYLVGFSWYL